MPDERVHDVKAVGSLPEKKKDKRVTVSSLSVRDGKPLARALEASTNSGGMTVLIFLDWSLCLMPAWLASRRRDNFESAHICCGDSFRMGERNPTEA